MKPLTIKEILEYIRLCEAIKVIEEEYKSVCSEFDLDPQISDIYYEVLKMKLDEEEWLEVIDWATDWATTLAQNLRFDLLLENRIDIEVMNRLISNLLEVIEVARIKCSREWSKQ